MRGVGRSSDPSRVYRSCAAADIESYAQEAIADIVKSIITFSACRRAVNIVPLLFAHQSAKAADIQGISPLLISQSQSSAPSTACDTAGKNIESVFGRLIRVTWTARVLL